MIRKKNKTSNFKLYVIFVIPLLFLAGGMILFSNSEHIDAIISDVSSIVIKDYDGVSRLQGSGYGIGAYEK